MIPLADSNAHTLSIIIVTYNSLPALEGCLNSLAAARSGADCELIVVDNGSTDSSLATVHDYFPDAVIIKNISNLGFAVACNIAAQTSRGEMLCFLNPDVLVDPDALRNCAPLLRDRPQVGLVSARVRYADGRFQPTCRRFPQPNNILFSRGSALSGLLGLRTSRSTVYTLPDYREVTVVPAASATFAVIRRALFLQLGGFDPRFFMYMEDTDLSLRLTQAGYQNLFAPSVGGVHLWWQGGKANIWRRQWYHHHSVWRYFLKHLPNGFTIMVLPFLLAGNYLVACMTMMLSGKSR